MLCSKYKSFSTLHKKEATILLSRCRQPTLKPSFSYTMRPCKPNFYVIGSHDHGVKLKFKKKIFFEASLCSRAD